MTKHSILIDTFNKYGSDYISCNIITLEEDKPRNLVGDYGTKPTQYYNNLCLRGHYYSERSNLGFISHGINYVDCDSLDFATVTKMAKTLKRIYACITKLQSTRAQTQRDFCQELMDLAISIDAEFIVTYTDKNGSNYDDSQYQFDSVQHGAAIVNNMINVMTNKNAA